MGIASNRGKYRKTIGEITEGILATVTDAVLFTIFVTAESPSRHIAKAFFQADEDLKKFNYQVLKRAVSALKTQGYLDSRGEITALGRERVEKLVPEIFSPTIRLTGELFLIIYDLNSNSRMVRNTLPKFLRKHHCVMISKSVYLSVVDPSLVLNEFLRKRPFQAQIIVAKMGKDSLIGGTRLRGYLDKLFGLKKLNEDYLEFIKVFEKGSKVPAMFYRFAQIARRDPNLPKEFLPNDWAGDRARNLVTYRHIHGTRDKK